MTLINKEFFIKNKTVIIYLVIVSVVLLIYVPFLAHFFNLSRNNPNSTFPIVGSSDSLQYATLADNLISHGRFSIDSEPPYAPETFRTPGYPALLAIFKVVFGSYKFFPILQIFLVVATALLIFKIGRKLNFEIAGFAAAILYAADPANIFYSLVILSDITFVFLLVLCVYLLFFVNSKKPYLLEGAAGAILGLATLVRPVSMFLPAFFVIFYFLFKRGRTELKKVFIGIFVLAAAYGLFFVPWTVRNRVLVGVWGLSSVKSFALFYYNVPEFLSVKYGQSPDLFRAKLRAETGIKDLQGTSLKYSAALDKVSFKYLKEDMLAYAEFHIIKTVPFFLTNSGKVLFSSYKNFQAENLTNFIFKGQFKGFFMALKNQPLAMTIEEIFWLVATFFAFASVFIRRQRLYILLFLAMVVYFAVLSGPLSYARLRLPATPFMFLLACMAVSALITRFRIINSR